MKIIIREEHTKEEKTQKRKYRSLKTIETCKAIIAF